MVCRCDHYGASLPRRLHFGVRCSRDEKQGISNDLLTLAFFLPVLLLSAFLTLLITVWSWWRMSVLGRAFIVLYNASALFLFFALKQIGPW